jgi:glycosyltransferase involved in cell wall biosynthesis
MNKDGIRAFESLPNCVVVDQFWNDKWFQRYPEDAERPHIGFGSGSLEAMSAGRPLITVFKDETFYEGNFPPILMAMTEPEIRQRLVEVWKMAPDERQAMGEAGREFVYRWHDWRNATPRYVDALERVFARSSRR